MPVATWAGIVEKGQIRMADGVCLPEKTLVFVVVPDGGEQFTTRVSSPRLANPNQASDFTKVVTVEQTRA